MGYEHYYEDMIEQFSHFQYPYEILRGEDFADLSADAKTLYCVMRNRLHLSKQNNWKDEKGRVYIIYTIKEVMADFRCGTEKAVKMIKELERKGLIEKIKTAKFGTPTLFYVNNFMSKTKAENKTAPISKIETDDFENRNRTDFENRNRRFRKSKSNYIDNSYIDKEYSAKNFAPHTQSDISDVFKALWKRYPLKRNKYKVTDEAKADMQKIGMDEMNRALDRYLTECKENSDWLQPMNGDTFFNNGYIDYLDANYTPRARQQPKPKKQNSFNNMHLRQQYDIDAIERMNESREPTKASPEIMQRADDLKRRLAAGS